MIIAVNPVVFVSDLQCFLWGRISTFK